MIKLFDTSIDIEVRLFSILSWTCMIANTVGFLSNLAFYGFLPDTIFYGICAVAMILLSIIAKTTSGERVVAGIMLVLINLIEFPVMYYLYGAGRIVYMILGILGVMVFTRKERRVVLSSLVLVLDIIIIIFSAVHPSEYMEVTPQSDLGAAIVSFVIVVVSIILIMILIVKQYESQNQSLLSMAEEMKKMAIRDPLTLLYNRRYLTEYLEERMTNSDESLSIILLDLDDFKGVNDTYGHLYGDEVLQNFASIIKSIIQDQGIAARFGGEEFMLVLHTTDEDEITELMSRIRQGYIDFSQDTKEIDLTFSGGVEMYHKPDRITRLFNAADEKLYLAKERGKDNVVFHKC